MPSHLSDLHVHSCCSDGLWEPSAIIDDAVRRGLAYIAITDHDSFEGFRLASEYLNTHPDLSTRITLIPGIEISTSHEGRSIHMLAYFIENPNSEFEGELSEMRTSRANRSLAIVGKMHDAGYPVSVDELKDSAEVVNRIALARLLVSRGMADNIGDVFDNLIGKDSPFYVPRDDMDTLHALELIGRSGGVAIMAHPALYHVVDLIVPLMASGLRGVEAFHSEQTPEQSEELVELATSNHLLITAGSDSHQDNVHPAEMGSVLYPERYLEEFLAADPR